MDRLMYPVRKAMQVILKRAYFKCLKDEIAEEFLKTLLKLMSVSFQVDKRLRKHIEGFRGSIQFRSRDDAIRVVAEFKDNKLKQRELKRNERLKEVPNATVVFKNAEGLMNFLLPKGGKRDVLRSLLKNEVALDGNFNYIYRFGFVANHMQLELAKMLK